MPSEIHVRGFPDECGPEIEKLFGGRLPERRHEGINLTGRSGGESRQNIFKPSSEADLLGCHHYHRKIQKQTCRPSPVGGVTRPARQSPRQPPQNAKGGKISPAARRSPPSPFLEDKDPPLFIRQRNADGQILSASTARGEFIHVSPENQRMRFAER